MALIRPYPGVCQGFAKRVEEITLTRGEKGLRFVSTGKT